MRILIASLMLASAATPAFAQNAMGGPVLPDGTLLDVVATGDITRVPDVATLRAGVVTQAPTATEASTQNANQMARVIAALRSAGIANRDIATASISLSPQYRYGDNQPPVITGYQATNTVSVKFRDISKSGNVLDALVKAGANQIDGPQLSIDQPAAALDAARVDAVKQARARAELYAQAAGLRVDRIVSINEQGENRGDQPRPPVLYARAMKADSAPEMMAGETEVSVTIAVRFLLK
ncbi:SIMPL domain-containing protein [Sphingomonas sp.]|jgi:uncharacterized protein YggE|uniref:SIMPL domain-containing protein n=1 Tax=Sphingomonas sp. TaxID=28214 RepID=UPI00261AEA03|nr:SIMPL domain-containing protein [Sphingomonas sp.]MDF2493591.1 hypothetical protein [Sphingomonas sp.]